MRAHSEKLTESKLSILSAKCLMHKTKKVVDMSSSEIENETNRLVQEVQDKCKVSVAASKRKQTSSENNNLDECISKYSTNKDCSGEHENKHDRESANSSPAGVDMNSNDEGYEVSSSGRSSSSSTDGQQQQQQQRTESPDSQTSSASITVLNPHSNQFPHRLVHLTEKLRVRFLAELDDSTKGELTEPSPYDGYDIEALRRQAIPCDQTGAPLEPEQSVAFRWLSRFVNYKTLSSDADLSDERTQKELDEAYERFKDYMKFRAQFQLSRALPDQFASEFYVMNGIFPFGLDKHGVPVLYLRARIHRRWSAKLNESFQRYVAWQIDTITRSHPEAKTRPSATSSGREKDGSFGICFDCLNVSYSCLDMDFLRYLVRLLVHNYPTYCRYALCVDLPWLFRSVWKLVRSWLPEDAQNSVQLITSKQLTEFIDEDQIPNSIKFNDLKSDEKPTKNKHQFPTNFSSIRGIRDLAEELNLSQSEVKQFLAHIDKIRKEYEQLGAI